MSSAKQVQKALSRRGADKKPRYSSQQITSTLSAFILALTLERDLEQSRLSELERGMLAMALVHVGIHPDMSLEQVDQALTRFLNACPPDDELLADLERALWTRRKK